MTSWNDIQNEIEKKGARANSPPSAAFWSDFNARARMTVQEAPASFPSRLFWTSAAFAGSIALLALVALPFFWVPDSMADSIQVTFVEVAAPHSGTTILNVISENGKDTGTIVWVSGLEESHDATP